jgi:hypothetical protein
VIATPIIRRKLIIFPTPKYLRIKNSVKANAKINPRLLLVNNVEKVNNIAKNERIKNIGIAKVKSGSTKYTRTARKIQSKRVITSVGKKFFRLWISLVRKCFFIVPFSLC